MDQVYESYRIQTSASQDLETGCWTPYGLILLEKLGGYIQHSITGPKNIFKTRDAAESYALQMAKWWIDDQAPVRVRKPDRVLV
jgi:hypothetical protein